MSRYIDADALIEYLKKMWSKWDEDDWYEAQAKDAMKDDIEIVNKQPTVDAVPAVLCGQCKHGSKCLLGVVQCKMYGYKHQADWFCADGERRSDEQ